MSVSDPLTSGLLFRARPRRSQRTSSSSPPAPPFAPLPASASLLTPPVTRRRSSGSHLSSLPPPASLSDLVHSNPQPLAVRAAAAALRAAGLEHEAAGPAGTSALRAARRVVEEHDRYPGDQNDVRRLFQDEKDDDDPFPSTCAALDEEPAFEIGAQEVEQAYDNVAESPQNQLPDAMYQPTDATVPPVERIEQPHLFTPRRSTRHRPSAAPQPSHDADDPPVNHAVPVLKSQPLTPRRSTRGHATLHHGVLSAPARHPLSTSRSAGGRVQVKEEPREPSRRASAPAGRTAKKRHRSMLSEVLRLQKSLETAQWTNSRDVSRQTEVIVISDDETPSARAKAVLLRRKAVREAAVVRVKEEPVGTTATRAQRSAIKKPAASAQAKPREETKRALPGRSGQASEEGPSKDDKRNENIAVNQTKVKPTEKKKANVSNKAPPKERLNLDQEDRRIQKKGKQIPDKEETSTAKPVTGRKRKSLSSLAGSKRVRRTARDESANIPKESTPRNGDVIRRVSPRQAKQTDVRALP